MILWTVGLALARERAPEAPIVWPAPPEPARVRAVDEIVTSDWAKHPDGAKGLGPALSRALGPRNTVGFKKPYGVAADDRGRVFVSDTGWGKVLLFDPQQREFGWIGDSGQGALQKPAGLTLDARGHLYVADLGLGVVNEYDDHGAFVRAWGGDRFIRPVGVAWNPVTNDLWVTDSREHQLEVFDLDTGTVRSIGTRGSDPGMFNYPTNVAAGPDGRVYVMDTFNFRVQVFDEQGAVLGTWGRNCDGFGCFAKPKGIAVAPDGRVFVADAAFNNVQIFGSDGTLLLAFGGVGNGRGRLYLPAGVAVSPDAHVFVVSQYNWRVNVYEYLGDGR